MPKRAYHKALALMEAGEVSDAAAELERAVQEHRSDWTLWQLLGNARDELGDAEGALEAYARALECPRVWAAPVRHNRAVALEKLDRHAEALTEAELALSDADREPYEGPAVNVAVTCLVELGRPHDAVELARTFLDRCPEDADDERKGALHVELAWALWLARGDRDAALAELRQASRLDGSNPRIVELIGELGGHHPSWAPTE